MRAALLLVVLVATALLATAATRGRAVAVADTRVASFGFLDSGSGTADGSLNVETGSSTDHEGITYDWKTKRNLRFDVPVDLNKAFSASASGTLVASWKTDYNGDATLGGVNTSFSCQFSGKKQEIPVTVQLSHDAGSADVRMTLDGTPPLGFEYFDPAAAGTSATGTSGCGTVHQHPARISPEYLFKSQYGPAGFGSDFGQARVIVFPLDVLRSPSGKSVDWPAESFTVTPGSSGSIRIDNHGKLFFAGCAGAPAKVTWLKGPASAGGGALKVGGDVCEGQTVTTGSRARIELQLADGSVIRVGPGSRVALDTMVFGKSAEDRNVSAMLEVGWLWSRVSHWVGADSKFEVATSASGGGVRGTTFEVVATHAKAHYHAIKDSIWTRGAGKTVVVHAGFCSDVVGHGKPSRPYRCGTASPLSRR